MTCEELRDDYGPYALGIAEEPERTEIAAHLARNCPECLRGVRQAMGFVTAMSGAVPLVDPPRSLRARVVGMVERKSTGGISGYLWAWASGAGMAALVLLAVFLPRQAANPDTARLAGALAILNDPGTRQVTFGENPNPSRGRAFVSSGKGVLFIGASLPGTATGKVFELWVIPAKGNPLPAGTFRRQADASAVYLRPGPVPADAAALAVTIEPEGGSPQPTTTPFLVMKLGGA